MSVTSSRPSSRRRIGLTGGIASGKSTVAAMLAERGALIIDSDAIVRELQEPGGAALLGIRRVFGDGVLTEDGRLDRKALGAVVFADPEALARLNGVVHPLVRAESTRRIAQAPEGTVIVEDIPLLVETGQAGAFDRVIVVQAPHQERVRRMVADRGLSEDEALARIESQASDVERAEVATDLILNDRGVDELRSRVDEVWATLV